MEDLTLETKKFPQITFRSSRVEKAGDGQWKVEGALSLHGVTKPVSLAVKRTGDAYTAHTALKQTDFAIKPVSVGGGLVKVKNEVEIDFQIFTRVK
jgi:polyisoprenoid-binding protein YceI